MSDTPRTDSQAFCRARAKGWIAPGKDAVSADFARQLERELAASQFALDASNGLRSLVMQERDELTKERDEARACLIEAMDEIEREHSVIKHRSPILWSIWRKAAGLEPQ